MVGGERIEGIQSLQAIFVQEYTRLEVVVQEDERNRGSQAV